MRRTVAVSIFPEMLVEIAGCGMLRRAIEKELMEFSVVNPRDYSDNEYRRVDDRPYGGGPGMVMMAEPLARAIDTARRRTESGRVVYLSPQGRRLDQALVAELAAGPDLVLLCGRYEGVDQRLLDSEVDDEISIGDYVLAGGELAAMVVLECVVRMLPGVLGNAESAEQDSFMEGLLDCRHYTRPESWRGRTVPEVLLSGDHGAIRKWRAADALAQTRARRPDLLESKQPGGHDAAPEEQTDSE